MSAPAFRLLAICPACDGEIRAGALSDAQGLQEGETRVIFNDTHKGQHCETCGKAYRITFTGTGGGGFTVAVEPNPEGDRGRYAVLLKLDAPGLESPLFVLLDRPGLPSQYYIEEGSCPTNFTDEIVKVYEVADGRVEGRAVDDDPHGLFTMVGWLPHPGDRTNEESQAFEAQWLTVMEAIAASLKETPNAAWYPEWGIELPE
jgi:hypothetical protein